MSCAIVERSYLEIRSYPGFLKSLDNWAAENTTQAVTSLLLTLAYTTLIDSLNIKMTLGCLNQNFNQENGFFSLLEIYKLDPNKDMCSTQTCAID